MPNKKFWDNSKLQQDVVWGNQQLPGITDEELYNTNWNMRWKKSEAQKEKISKSMSGKTLEELIGKEQAAEGRKKRSETHRGKTRPRSTVEKMTNARKAKGGYDVNPMQGKKHKDSTKSMQSIKAGIRQELKRQLGLGKSDKVPQDLLDAEYKKRGLQ